MKLTDLEPLAAEMQELQAKIEAAATALAVLQEEHRALSEEVLVDAFDSLDLREIATASGLTLVLDGTLRASASKDRLGPVAEWLRREKHGALVKRAVTVNPPTDELGEALVVILRSHNFEFSDMPSVNAQSLSKFVRETMAKGIYLPQDLLGVYYQCQVKIKGAK
jgi:hypothetical protein